MVVGASPPDGPLPNPRAARLPLPSPQDWPTCPSRSGSSTSGRYSSASKPALLQTRRSCLKGRQGKPTWKVLSNRSVDGFFVRGTFAGMSENQTMIVDRKLITRQLDVTHDESPQDSPMMWPHARPPGDGSRFSEAAKRRPLSVRGILIDVFPLDELQLWVPRRPVLATTAGTDWQRSRTPTMKECCERRGFQRSSRETC